MHHELLLALSGCPGNVFITSRETGQYELVSDLPFVHPSEVTIVNKIVRLGSQYRTLEDFVSEQLHDVVSIGDTPPGGRGTSQGLYLRAMAFGVDDVLDGYRQRLVDVEKQCIEDACLPLSNIQWQFEEYHTLFSSLVASLRTIERDKIHGCVLLSFIHDKCVSGIPRVKEAYESILGVVCRVFYKQISVWMSRGNLTDRFNEFFISPVGRGQQGARLEYQIVSGMKPSFIPMRVAEKILFIGEAVGVFREKQTSGTSQTASRLSHDQLQFTRLLSTLQDQRVFNLREFEAVCNSVRDTVAEHLWRLVVEESDLLGSLQLMKEFFLLGRGELFLTFINMADTFLSQPSTTASEHDVNVAFSQTLVKMGFEGDSLINQFHFTLPAVKQSTKALLGPKLQQDSTGKGWSLLGLAYRPQWPLQVVFTPPILEKYNALFKFLLAMKRAQVDLHKSWHLQMSRRQRCQGVWQLRLHMSFLLDNLQYYVQVDVLETQFMQLVDKINSSHDFEYVNHAHQQFLTTLQSQLFFKTPPVALAINEILEVCHRYYGFVRNMGEELTLREVGILERLTKDFQRHSSLLFRILSGVKSLHSSPHLSQLLLRIDYNKYFSSKMSSLTSTVSSLSS